MKNTILPALLLATLSACNSSQTTKHESRDSAFTQYEQHFLDSSWRIYPDRATSVGYHAYDTLLIVPDSAARQNELTFVQQQLDSLQSYDTTRLSNANLIDYYLIRNTLLEARWQINDLRAFEWDPSYYNVSQTFALILNEHYAPLETRLRSFYQRLVNVPAYYEAARKQIIHPVPELTKLAAEQNKGGLSIFRQDLADSLKHSQLSATEQQQILDRAQTAINAIQTYADWLSTVNDPQGRSFRLGEPLYSQKFAFEIQSAYTAAQIYDSAVARKQYLHGQMALISKQLWPKYFGSTPMPADSLVLIRRMIDTLSVQHVKPEEFQHAIEQQIPQLVAFVDKKGLLYQDPSKPLIVRKEPAYMAGVAGASISAPGPYDKTGNTYYNVGSLEGWPKEQAESYLREYNRYILQILNIHEAIPGHYTQQVYANRSPSLIKAILGNGAMIEGWAVYTEQMMLENGYGDNAPEMWLMWYKWHLRTVCNTILDYSVHTKNLSKEDAIKLLTYEAFQQQAEAEGKWKRVSVTNVQLTSYFTGYKEIIDLRTALQQKLGAKFDLKTFNEQFLSYGNAPVQYIRRMMLRDGM